MLHPASTTNTFSLLLVCRSYPPVLGGSEIEAQRVCAALIRRGHKVTVLCAGGPPMPETSHWVDPEGVPVRIFANKWPERLRDYVFALGVAWTLIRDRRRYQFVYFLMQGIHLAAGLPVSRWLGKPILMKISGSNLITLMRQSWLGRLEIKWLQQWARRVMILNEGMAQEAASAGFEQRQLLWMPNPVETDRFAPCAPATRVELRAALKIPADALVILFVGRLAPEKEVPSLLEAFASIAQSFPQAVLVLAGDGPERPSLERKVSELRIEDRVRFVGRQALAEVIQWMQVADIFTLISSLEGFAVSLVEAMSAGLPSVVSDIPANLQLIDADVHGLLIKVRDPASIAAALSRLLSDPALRERMGALARQRVIDNYSTEKVLQRYEALFAEATAAA